MNVSDVTRIFYFNRLSSRVFTHDPDGWLIKGGQALLVRYRGAARLSGDIDLQTASSTSPEQARQKVLEAAALDLGDFLRFAPGRHTTVSDNDRGCTQYFQVYLGPTRVDGIKVDISISRQLAGTPEVRELSSAVDILWPVDWPTVRLYPVIDHLADKICALYERHSNGGSSRYRDLADLLLISQQEKIDGPTASHALHQEAARRQTHGIDITLPATFQSPGPEWADQYPAAAALVIGLDGCRTLPQAASAAHTFLTPLLQQTAHSTWDPERRSWAA
ncbi:nucleotidyl transferase AbiEii/AbiGii toxin family protein [Streptomyces sp. NPDC056002]|uniref:nucleotidyl transferase AbiEii/AbiGii toxin family protein n=1 Tax=Streptomyces sp. NPDC056002 TaxID=3345675 RepID=UPI0035E2AD01